MAELTVTSGNFQKEVAESDIPVLLDFWASWCGPCRMLSPVIAELASEYEGKIKVGKVNVDEEPALADAFKVNAIPMLALIKDGTLADSAVGFRPKADIVAMLEKK